MSSTEIKRLARTLHLIYLLWGVEPDGHRTPSSERKKNARKADA